MDISQELESLLASISLDIKQDKKNKIVEVLKATKSTNELEGNIRKVLTSSQLKNSQLVEGLADIFKKSITSGPLLLQSSEAGDFCIIDYLNSQDLEPEECSIDQLAEKFKQLSKDKDFDQWEALLEENFTVDDVLKIKTATSRFFVESEIEDFTNLDECLDSFVFIENYTDTGEGEEIPKCRIISQDLEKIMSIPQAGFKIKLFYGHLAEAVRAIQQYLKVKLNHLSAIEPSKGELKLEGFLHGDRLALLLKCNTIELDSPTNTKSPIVDFLRYLLDCGTVLSLSLPKQFVIKSKPNRSKDKDFDAIKSLSATVMNTSQKLTVTALSLKVISSEQPQSYLALQSFSPYLITAINNVQKKQDSETSQTAPSSKASSTVKETVSLEEKLKHFRRSSRFQKITDIPKFFIQTEFVSYFLAKTSNETILKEFESLIGTKESKPIQTYLNAEKLLGQQNLKDHVKKSLEKEASKSNSNPRFIPECEGVPPLITVESNDSFCLPFDVVEKFIRKYATIRDEATKRAVKIRSLKNTFVMKVDGDIKSGNLMTGDLTFEVQTDSPDPVVLNSFCQVADKTGFIILGNYPKQAKSKLIFYNILSGITKTIDQEIYDSADYQMILNPCEKVYLLYSNKKKPAKSEAFQKATRFLQNPET